MRSQEIDPMDFVFAALMLAKLALLVAWKGGLL